MLIIHPTQEIPLNTYSIFLAGSVEQEQTETWRDKVATALSKYDFNLLNPCRDDWGSTWNA